MRPSSLCGAVAAVSAGTLLVLASTAFSTVFLSACADAPDAAPAPSGFAGWPAYGGDAGGSRWSPLTEIDRGNVAALEPAWVFSPMVMTG